MLRSSLLTDNITFRKPPEIIMDLVCLPCWLSHMIIMLC